MLPRAESPSAAVGAASPPGGLTVGVESAPAAAPPRLAPAAAPKEKTWEAAGGAGAAPAAPAGSAESSAAATPSRRASQDTHSVAPSWLRRKQIGHFHVDSITAPNRQPSQFPVWRFSPHLVHLRSFEEEFSVLQLEQDQYSAAPLPVGC